MKAATANKFFDIFVITLAVIITLLCILPFLNVLAISLSSNHAIINQKVFIWPVEWNLESYISIFKDAAMTGALLLTTQITIVYTIFSMILTIAAAYPLTQKRLRGRSFFLFIIVFTMFFTGGTIPDYILMKNLNLVNTVWSLILPTMISGFNFIIMKTFFSSLPESLMESARLDGCSDFSILTKIVLPLSLPVLATIGLFYAVAKWNSFQDALIYISDTKLYPLQLKLYQIVQNSQSVEIAVQEGSNTTTNTLPESLRAASIMFGTIPIVLVYPWLQRYFIKGVMIGAIKG